jgi:hypothetical protein
MFIASCSENLHPGTSRKEVCDAVDHSVWTAAALWPAVLFAASPLVRPCRRHVGLTAIAIAALGVAFWIPLLLIASSSLFSD